jgi:hypothetical protein
VIKRFLIGLSLGILLSTLVCKADAHADSFGLELDPSGVASEEMPILQTFVSSVSQLLPEAMKNKIGRKIRVRFSQMGTSSLEVPACMDNPQANSPTEESVGSSDKTKMEILGHDNYNGHSSVVDLNALFKQEIKLGPDGTRTFPCGHRNMYRLATATLIHELAHVYDANLGKEQSSKNTYFQKLMGFTKQWSWHKIFLLRTLEEKNQLALRSPDPYEFKSEKESFAVNMEFFVLDPEFGCRRPTVDHYYRSLMGITSQPTCNLNTTVMMNSDNPALNLKQPLSLDPKRIYDIHFLLASKGTAMMSRWGHAMYRIIVCAPERKEVGPDCLQDVQYHVILSYRANIDDLVLSYWKGLNGDYPSQLYILPLPEILTEYNKIELRDLDSVPLKLTEDEKTQFLYRTLEQYWEYQGRYYFFTNNCADEAENMLQGIVPDPKIQKIHDMTPVGLFGDLNKDGIIDDSVLKNTTSAVEQGYLFQSKKPILDNAFQQISSHLKSAGTFTVKSSDDYMNNTTADQRRDVFNSVMKVTTGDDHVKMAAYFYLLESYVSSIDQQTISTKVASRIETMGGQKKNGASTEDNGINDELIKTLEAAQPWSNLTSGYGIAMPADVDTQMATVNTNHATQAYNTFENWMTQQFKPELEEFQKIQLNMIAYTQAITGKPS